MTHIVNQRTRKCVLYRSKYGSTRAYAEALADRLHCQALPVETCTAADLKGIRQVIYGGAFRNGHILGSKTFFRLTDGLPLKRAVFTTCMTVYDEATMKKLRDRTIPPEDPSIPLFYTRGRWNPKDMTFIDRQLLRGILKNLESTDAKQLSLSEETLMGLDQEPKDYVDFGYLDVIERWSYGAHVPGVGVGHDDPELHQRVQEGIARHV